ncbi:MAG: preprotein translocase subunit SecE [Halothiobacillaceae bacterium]|jgi:preprotein translocase subunit SecE|nr:preprotein translocase subunit SecE [Halothiobacillaceae bacterium]MDY0049678.1 preprotein translocase subunit SecE [Halothiobacillaceae bacterium]
MLVKAETQSSKLDTFKLASALIVLLAGIVGFYALGAQPLFVRIAVVLAAVAVGLGLVYTTAVGKGLWAFARDSRSEVRKMVWPTRQETVQTTLVVLLVVVLIGLFLWLVDSLLMWAVRGLTGQGG